MSRIVGFYRFDDGSAVGCQACGWQGRFEELRPGIASERFDLLAFACPRWDEEAYIANAPTLDETRRAAHAGNSRAIAELAEMETLKARRTAIFATLLVDPQRLPEVEAAGPTALIWDQETMAGTNGPSSGSPPTAARSGGKPASGRATSGSSRCATSSARDTADARRVRIHGSRLDLARRRPPHRLPGDG